MVTVLPAPAIGRVAKNLCIMAIMGVAEPYGEALGRVLDSRSLDKPAGSIPPAMRTFGLYAAVLVVDGGGIYVDGRGLRVDIAAGDLIVVFPELPHRYGPVAGGPWREHFVTFVGPVFDLWRKAGLLRTDRPVWSVSPVERWARSMRAIHRAGDAAPVGVGRLQAWLAEAATAQPWAGSPEMPDLEAWVADARARLEANLDRSIDLHAVARELGLSFDRFRKGFRRAVGVSPGRYRADRTVRHAQALMRTTAMTDCQIADALGFCDPFYFSRRFKQLTGQSPRGFRRSLDAPAAG